MIGIDNEMDLATLLGNIDINKIRLPVLRRILEERVLTSKDGKERHNDHADHSDHKEKYSEVYIDCSFCHGDWHKDYIMTRDVRNGYRS